MIEVINVENLDIPEKCRKCPVIGRYVLLSKIFNDDEKKLLQQSVEWADKAAVVGESENEIHSRLMRREFAMANVESADRVTERWNGLLADFNQILEHIDPDCEGPGRNWRNREQLDAKFVEFITRARSCNNSGFEELSAQPSIATQLTIGHWQNINQEQP